MSRALIFGVLLLVAACSDDGRNFERQKIAQCWGNQAKKSLEPSTARFIASVCERLEREFEEKYHVKP